MLHNTLPSLLHKFAAFAVCTHYGCFDIRFLYTDKFSLHNVKRPLKSLRSLSHKQRFSAETQTTGLSRAKKNQWNPQVTHCVRSIKKEKETQLSFILEYSSSLTDLHVQCTCTCTTLLNGKPDLSHLKAYMYSIRFTCKPWLVKNCTEFSCYYGISITNNIRET